MLTSQSLTLLLALIQYIDISLIHHLECHIISTVQNVMERVIAGSIIHVSLRMSLPFIVMRVLYVTLIEDPPINSSFKTEYCVQLDSFTVFALLCHKRTMAIKGQQKSECDSKR